MQTIDCTFEAHAREILDIFNGEIVHSTSLYDYKPRTKESMIEWFKSKAAARFPIIGAVDDDGQLRGFATYGTFRVWPAYKYTVEHSVYVHTDHRRKGLGKVLMRRLIAAAKEQQYHVMVGVIDSGNQASIALHRQLGFVPSGVIKQAGFKFGRWLDVAFYQLLLETPTEPVDG